MLMRLRGGRANVASAVAPWRVRVQVVITGTLPALDIRCHRCVRFRHSRAGEVWGGDSADVRAGTAGARRMLGERAAGGSRSWGEGRPGALLVWLGGELAHDAADDLG